MRTLRRTHYIYAMAYITSGQIAKERGISVRTVHRMIAAGDLVEEMRVPGYSGARLFDPDKVAEVFERRSAKPETVSAA